MISLSCKYEEAKDRPSVTPEVTLWEQKEKKFWVIFWLRLDQSPRDQKSEGPSEEGLQEDHMKESMMAEGREIGTVAEERTTNNVSDRGQYDRGCRQQVNENEIEGRGGGSHGQ
eukprot:g45208.t1